MAGIFMAQVTQVSVSVIMVGVSLNSQRLLFDLVVLFFLLFRS